MAAATAGSATRRSAANCSRCLNPMPALHQHAADLGASCAASGLEFQSPLYSGQQQDYNRQGGLQSPTSALNSKHCVSSVSAATRRSIALQVAKQEETVAQLWRASHDGQVKSSCQVCSVRQSSSLETKKAWASTKSASTAAAARRSRRQRSSGIAASWRHSTTSVKTTRMPTPGDSW